MTYLVNAWFERSNPYLRIIHRETGKSVLYWQGEQLRSKFQYGGINMEDFADNADQELVKELFLLDCLQQT